MKYWIKSRSISKTEAIQYITIALLIYSAIYLVFCEIHMPSVDDNRWRDIQLSEAELRDTSLIKKITVENIEQDNLSYCNDQSIMGFFKKLLFGQKQVPFGCANRSWLDFKSRFNPGDELWTFRYSWNSGPLASLYIEGFCIVRKSKIIRTWATESLIS